MASANDGENIVAAPLPMLKDDGKIYYASTPTDKNKMFAPLFSEPKEGADRIVVPGTLISCLKTSGACLRQQLSATRFLQVIEVETFSDGQSYFDLSIIEKVASHENEIWLG